jgi:hypothetical protein
VIVPQTLSTLLQPLQIPVLEEISESLKRQLPMIDLSNGSKGRLEEFETFVIDSFTNVILKTYLPPVGDYFSEVFEQIPDLRAGLVNTMGQFGIKALAGVAVVMCKPFPAETVQKALPSIYSVFMHHLLEVVSDKISGKQIARQLCVPEDMVDVFNVLALQILNNEAFSAVHPHFIDYLNSCSLLELRSSKLYNTLLSNVLFNEDIISVVKSVKPDIEIDKLKNFFEYPVRYCLLLNLLTVEVARAHLENVSVFSKNDQVFSSKGKAVLYDFAIKALKQRYNSAAFLNRHGYESLSLREALNMRADAILTDYTMASVISGLAAADPKIEQIVAQNRANVEDTIRKATYLIGLANDCGSRLLEMEIPDLVEFLADVADQAAEVADPRVYFSVHHHRIKPSHPEYRLFFPIMKDARKGEENLALDMRLLKDVDLWVDFIHNVVSLAAVFQRVQRDLEIALQQLGHKGIEELIRNFVDYNFQIYDAAADYDEAIPVIEHLPIMIG